MGKKFCMACESVQRESKEAWLLIIRDLIARGLAVAEVNGC